VPVAPGAAVRYSVLHWDIPWVSQAFPWKNTENATKAMRSQEIETERAELAEPLSLSRLPPVHNVWFAHVPVDVHKGSFAVLTMVLNCAIAAEAHPALLLFMQVARVLTASQT